MLFKNLRSMTRCLALGLLAPLAAVGPAAATVIFRGDMETGTLKQFQTLTNPNRISVVQAPVREGKYAAKLDILNGDAGNGSFRVELGYQPAAGPRRDGVVQILNGLVPGSFDHPFVQFRPKSLQGNDLR